MKTYIGIDLGTSSVKVLLVGEEGHVLNTVSETYPVSYPHPGWSEQSPELWMEAVDKAVIRLLKGRNRDQENVCGIGFGGQMHGLVVLDKEDKVIRPCILWNDGRTEEETKYLNEVIGKDKLSEWTANIAFAGFTAPKILWMKKNEPENFAKIDKIMLPKDYIAYRLTGTFCTDYSDASGFLLLDVKNKRYSKEMLDICGITEAQLPKLFESYEVVGTVNKEWATRWGIKENVVVVAGAGDNAAAAIGTGTVKEGDCNISLGTSGTVFISSDKFSVDKNNSLHSFDHANGKYHLMGCILSAASCNAWWMDVLETKDFAREQEGLMEKIGDNSLFFLPYLMGERSPHNDVNAKGAFIGIRPTTSRFDMTLAVMEGVAFALRDCIEIARANGVVITSTKICGGGAKSPLWRKIIANVCGVTVNVPTIEEGPSYGGALLAMVGDKRYSSVDEVVDAVIRTRTSVEPDPELVAKYNNKYETFRVLYPALKDVYKLI
ncbi:MAG: xylulokinase [Bacilli bacterium]|nr:xylulokinase [Bacilli bacterium]